MAIEDMVDVLAELVGIELGEPRPALDQHPCRGSRSPYRPKLGHLAPIAGDGQAFSVFNPVDDLPPMVAQLADRNFSHAIIVSRVRQGRRNDLPDLGSRGAIDEPGQYQSNVGCHHSPPV